MKNYGISDETLRVITGAGRKFAINAHVQTFGAPNYFLDSEVFTSLTYASVNFAKGIEDFPTMAPLLSQFSIEYGLSKQFQGIYDNFFQGFSGRRGSELLSGLSRNWNSVEFTRRIEGLAGGVELGVHFELNNYVASTRAMMLDLVGDRAIERLVADIVDQANNSKLERADVDLGVSEFVSSDEVLLACFERIAPILEAVQNRTPELTVGAINGLGKLLAVSLLELLWQMPGILLVIYGPTGFVLGLIAIGAIKMVPERRWHKMGRRTKAGLEAACPTCKAPPGYWCITTRGTSPGSPASTLHRPRL